MRNPPPFPEIKIGDSVLQEVTHLSLLGVTLQCNMKWGQQIDLVVQKASRRLFMLCILKKYNASCSDLVTIYASHIRPILEYASPVWSSSITCQQSEKVERVQRRVTKIILGFTPLTYDERLESLNLPSLQARRIELDTKFAHSLLTSRRPLRNNHGLVIPRCRTSRYQNSAVPSLVRTINKP